MGSGHADYETIIERFHDVPIVRATKESLDGYGIFYADRDEYDQSPVIQVQWPRTTHRAVDVGTGYGDVTSGPFTMTWIDGICYGRNEAVNGDYKVARYHDEYIYTREANYHPDSGQKIFSRGLGSFILYLAKPSVDPTPNDFIAFQFENYEGVQILPNVWHQPAIPLYPETKAICLDNSQGSIHACVIYDSVMESGIWLRTRCSTPKQSDKERCACNTMEFYDGPIYT